ncbi:MAG TPA: GerMN domain-containing protein [Oculatellaceae cyanobacterium]
MPTQKRRFKTPFEQARPWLALAAVSFVLNSCAERTILRGADKDKKRDAPVIANSNASTHTLGTDGDAQKQAGTENAKIWFVKEQGGELRPTPVERTLSLNDPIKDATDQLLRGPTQVEQEAGIRSEIPVGTLILGVEKKGPITELNLSQRFATGGTSSVEARLSQLENTIRDVAGKSKVFLDVEGHRLLTAGDGMEVKQPIN